MAATTNTGDKGNKAGDLNRSGRNEKPLFLCTGSDRRQIYAAERLHKLCSDRADIYAYCTDGRTKNAMYIESLDELPRSADMLVLPIMLTPPAGAGGLTVPCAQRRLLCSDFTDYLRKGAVVSGGRMGTPMIEYFNSLGFDTADYFRREELVIKNCVPTAEGALALAMQELDVTVSGTRVLICGWGRVAKACARLFGAAGARVCIAARKLSQLAEAQSMGHDTVRLTQLSAAAGSFPLIINTIPAMVLTKEVLYQVCGGCLIIDLASKPGGTDFAVCSEMGIKALHALSLPGKCAPVTAGEIIADTVFNIYNERSGRNVT